MAKKKPAKKATAKKLPRKKSAAKPDPKQATTFGEVAKHFSVSYDTVRRSWVAAGMPGLPASLDAIEEWRATLKSSRQSRFEKDDHPATIARNTKLQAEARRTMAEAMISEHKAELLNESLCTIDQVDSFLSELFTELRTMMTRLPEELASSYPKVRHQLEEDCRARVDLILRAVYGHAENLAQIKEH